MPISYTVDDEKKRMYTRATGLVTFEELRAHMNAEEGKPAGTYKEIFDCSDATTDVTTEQIRSLVAERIAVAQRRTPSPVAIVANTDLFFGIMRMFDSMSDSIRPIRVFREREAAAYWLESIPDG